MEFNLLDDYKISHMILILRKDKGTTNLVIVDAIGE